MCVGVKRELGGDAGGSGHTAAKRQRQDSRGRDITLRFLLQSKVKLPLSMFELWKCPHRTLDFDGNRDQ